MPRHDRSYGAYHAPGSKGGSRRRKLSTGNVGASGGRRSGRKSKYAIKKERRAGFRLGRNGRHASEGGTS